MQLFRKSKVRKPSQKMFLRKGRPRCAKCGKKIRDLRKVVYFKGKPYHKKCLSKGD